jgi:putative oxidoreductase
MKYLVLLGRILFALLFVMAGFGHFTKAEIGYAESAGVPMASVVVPFSGILAIVGGLSIAAGYKAKWGAWLIVLFLIPVTFAMHAFWKVTDPQMAQMQQAHFFKNISMLGAALFTTQMGSGPVSLKD